MKKVMYLLLPLLLFVLASSSLHAQAVADPASITVLVNPDTVNVDGLLNEAAWMANIPHLKFRFNGTPSGQGNTPTNAGLVVKPPYRDSSTTTVKFIRYGMNLYLGFQSNDQQVCRFGDSWEGDGLFIKIKNSVNADVEYKLYYNLGGVNPEMNYEGPAHSRGKGVKGPGTIVNDSASLDGGYSAELLINLTGLGYTVAPATIQIMIVCFDPDDYTDGQLPWGANGNFGKQWWGSEWGPDMRTLNLSTTPLPVELTSFNAIANKGIVELQWQTATETNNKGFEIERTIDGTTFQSIAFVDGHGTSSEVQSYRFVDNAQGINAVVGYRLKQIDYSGSFSYSNVAEVDLTSPLEFSLQQNYPNPFNPATIIAFGLPVSAKVVLEVYNITGELVAMVANSTFDAGSHAVPFDASSLNSGVYIYKLSAFGENGENYFSAKKLTLMK